MSTARSHAIDERHLTFHLGDDAELLFWRGNWHDPVRQGLRPKVVDPDSTGSLRKQPDQRLLTKEVLVEVGRKRCTQAHPEESVLVKSRHHQLEDQNANPWQQQPECAREGPRTAPRRSVRLRSGPLPARRTRWLRLDERDTHGTPTRPAPTRPEPSGQGTLTCRAAWRRSPVPPRRDYPTLLQVRRQRPAPYPASVSERRRWRSEAAQ